MSATTVTHIQNVYGGTLMQGARQVSYHLLDETEARSWYHYSGPRSIHLLKADHLFTIKKDMYVITTEMTEHTLQSWVQNNANNIINSVTGEPTEEFFDDIGCLGRPSNSKNPSRPNIDIDGFSNILNFVFRGLTLDIRRRRLAPA
ncbi:hypothetical protein ACFX13_016735 [Malus domestica]